MSKREQPAASKASLQEITASFLINQNYLQ